MRRWTAEVGINSSRSSVGKASKPLEKSQFSSFSNKLSSSPKMNALIVLSALLSVAVAIPAYGPAPLISTHIATAIPAPILLKSAPLIAHAPLANVALASSQLLQTPYAPGYPYASQAAYPAPAIGHAPLALKAPLGLGLGLGLGHGLYGGLGKAAIY